MVSTSVQWSPQRVVTSLTLSGSPVMRAAVIRWCRAMQAMFLLLWDGQSGVAWGTEQIDIQVTGQVRSSRRRPKVPRPNGQWRGRIVTSSISVTACTDKGPLHGFCQRWSFNSFLSLLVFQGPHLHPMLFFLFFTDRPLLICPLCSTRN